MLNIERVRDAPAQPWRNGGGSTRELLRWPPAAAPDDPLQVSPQMSSQVSSQVSWQALWQVRISLADILQDGPFSAFAGVQRWFAVVQGEGVQLQLGQQQHRLTPASAPLQFDGAAAPGCQLLGGPTRDLNLMLQGCTGGMLAAQPGVPWQAPLPAVHQPQGALPRLLRAVYCADAARLHIGDRPALDLPAMSLGWWLQNGGADDAPGIDSADWHLNPMEPMDPGAGRAWWLWAWCHGLTTPRSIHPGAHACA